MGNLFPAPDYPDYVPFPSLMVEARLVIIRLGPLSLVVAVLLLQNGRSFLDEPAEDLGISHLDSSHADVFDLPHTHAEMQDPAPPASYLAMPGQGSSSGDPFPSWRGNSIEVANEIANRAWRTQMDYHALFASTSSTMSPALLNFASTGLD